MRTDELIGEKLDYWVASAGGWELDTSGSSWWQLATGIGGGDGGFYIDMGECHKWSPSTDWGQGGPIVEATDITLIKIGDTWEAGMQGDLEASGAAVSFCGNGSSGETPLIAAMRAFVRSAFGEEVTDEL